MVQKINMDPFYLFIRGDCINNSLQEVVLVIKVIDLPSKVTSPVHFSSWGKAYVPKAR